jgi:branched-chain amino acid transport system permease protein
MKRSIWVLSLGTMLFLCVLPLFVPNMMVWVMSEAYIWILFAVATNIVLGYGGRITFGHAAFFGSGGYICAIAVKQWGVMIGIGIVFGAIGAAILGIIIGWFCVRLTHVYFAMLTMAFGQLVWAVVYRWRYVGADTGMIGVPMLGSPIEFYFSSLAFVCVSLFIIWIIIRSPFGRILVASRENEVRSTFIGINVKRQQLYAFVISAFFSGLSGGLFVILNGIAYPDIFTWVYSGQVLVMCLLGGMAVFFGPAIGAIMLVLLQHWITGFTEYWPIVLGIVIVLLVLFLPNGILGTILGTKSKPSWLVKGLTLLRVKD